MSSLIWIYLSTFLSGYIQMILVKKSDISVAVFGQCPDNPPVPGVGQVYIADLGQVGHQVIRVLFTKRSTACCRWWLPWRPSPRMELAATAGGRGLFVRGSGGGGGAGRLRGVLLQGECGRRIRYLGLSVGCF